MKGRNSDGEKEEQGEGDEIRTDVKCLGMFDSG